MTLLCKLKPESFCLLLADKKEEAQRAHEQEQLSQSMNKENVRHLYPDELGIYQRGIAHKQHKKDVLEAYESSQYSPRHPKPKKTFVLGNNNWSCESPDGVKYNSIMSRSAHIR